MKEDTMKTKIDATVTEMRARWKNLTMDSIRDIQDLIKNLGQDPDVKGALQEATRDLPKGLELYRDPAEGYILLAYTEARGTYRMPHNHGDAWVIYAVVDGQVDMGCYFNATGADGSNHLVLKSQETLQAGDTRLYLPGEIHDTRCISESAVILRLTSLDLKSEEAGGRMKRFVRED
jgi:hypothetical protein